MILGIGIDSVDVQRFTTWNTYSYKILSRIFSQEEIEYCLHTKNKSAERFAVRFAAREALFKAFTAMKPDHSIPFLTLCKNSRIIKKDRHPILYINWSALSICTRNTTLTTHLSLTHTDMTATAWIIIEAV